VAQLRREKIAFDRLGAAVVLVGLGSIEQTAAFKARFDVPFPMIADQGKRLFEAFRLKRAATGTLLSAKMVFRGVTAMAKGHGIGAPQGDLHQLPGVFIIGTDGRILFSHHASGPADHPSPDVLLDVLKGECAA
jgi:peroxiredoxin